MLIKANMLKRWKMNVFYWIPLQICYLKFHDMNDDFQACLLTSMIASMIAWKSSFVAWNVK